MQFINYFASILGNKGLSQTKAEPSQPGQHQRMASNIAANTAILNPMALSRSPVYWTLQNRRSPRPALAAYSGSTSRDDLYATPVKRSERRLPTPGVFYTPAQNPSMASENSTQFTTSTPIRRSEMENIHSVVSLRQQLARYGNLNDNSPERLNTCADRIGQSKTSLMDFKKLLLAKSTKTSTLTKKVSAVELLKKSQSPTPTATSSNPISTIDGQNLTNDGHKSALTPMNSSMKLLDLSGSPKTFASRKMLRQGQFGSPSKCLAPKLKGSPGGWRSQVASAVNRTDVMSITIPEASNSEEDQSGSSGASRSRSACGLNSCSPVSVSTRVGAIERNDVHHIRKLPTSPRFSLPPNSDLDTAISIIDDAVNVMTIAANGENDYNKSYLMGSNSANAAIYSARGLTAATSQSLTSVVATATHRKPALETAL